MGKQSSIIFRITKYTVTREHKYFFTCNGELRQLFYPSSFFLCLAYFSLLPFYFKSLSNLLFSSTIFSTYSFSIYMYFSLSTQIQDANERSQVYHDWEYRSDLASPFVRRIIQITILCTRTCGNEPIVCHECNSIGTFNTKENALKDNT